MNFDYQRLYLTADGRIGRQDFWMGILGFVVVGIVVSLIIGLLFGTMSTAGRWIGFIVQLAFAYPSYNLMAKRFQDRDKPAMFALYFIGATLIYSLLGLLGLFGNPMQPNILGTLLGLAVGVAAIWLLIELGVLRGTIGQNQYGPDPVGP